MFPVDYVVGEFYHLRYTTDFSEFTLPSLLLLGTLVAPFFEELLFRFPLKYKKNYLFQFFDLSSPKKVFKKFWLSKYPFFFYLSAFGFGLIHMMNYDNKFTITFLLLSIFITISQLSGGLIMGYLRLKYGFVWGFFYHALWNFVVFLGMYLIYHNTELINYNQNGTKIQLTELNVLDGNGNIFISNKIDRDLIYEIEMKNGNLQYLLDIVAPKYHSDDLNTIHFKLKSETGIKKSELFEILRENIDIDSINN